MQAKVTAISTSDEKDVKNISKETLELFGGHSANICYTQKDWDEILQEDYSKTVNRVNGNKKNNHHSVFGHTTITLYLTDIPKLLAMLLNNEHEYNTSEKSARYTKMYPTEKELFLYEKWIKIFETKIKKTYSNEGFLNDKRIHKLAMENARYLISVMTPTKMKYTTSFRQWNYLYGFVLKMLNQPDGNTLIDMLKPSLEEFKDCLEKTGLIDLDIKDYHHRGFSLIVENNDYPEYFGRCYSTNYMATFASVAQQHRHRTLDYNIVFPTHKTYYIPPIILQDEELKKMWLQDISSLESLVPQGTLLCTNETGKYEDFIMKLEERLCSCAQLETCMQNYQTLLKYVKFLRESEDIRNKPILESLEKYEKGARCLTGYCCTEPCRFYEGIHLTRKI